jgi:hypothetical protein
MCDPQALPSPEWISSRNCPSLNVIYHPLTIRCYNTQTAIKISVFMKVLHRTCRSEKVDGPECEVAKLFLRSCNL